MSGLDVLGALSSVMPQAPAPGEDPGVVVVGTVFAVDVANRRAQVAVRGAVMWLPAQPGRYRVATSTLTSGQGLARVLLSTTTGRPVLVLGPVDPDSEVQTGTVTATTSSPPTVTLTLRGVSRTLPAIPSTYTIASQAWVLTDDWATPVLVIGPTTAPADSTPAAPTPPSGPSTVQATTTIGPQWCSTWVTKWSHWTEEGSYWNAGRYGGASTLYQDQGHNSSKLYGMATYGDQFLNLGAISIDAVTLTMRGAGLQELSYPAIVAQGSASGSKPGAAPTTSGDTISASPGRSGVAQAAFTSGMREAARTGTLKSLVLVGAGYGAVLGTGDSMVATVTYTRAA